MSSIQTNSRLTSKIKLPPTTYYIHLRLTTVMDKHHKLNFSLARSLFSVVFDCPKMYLDYLLLSCCRLRLFIVKVTESLLFLLALIRRHFWREMLLSVF
jgi:hypothetical protein